MHVIKDKWVKTRKAHNCWGCTMVLPKGSIVLAVTSVEDNRIATAYWCDVCAEIAEDVDDGNGFCYGDMKQEAEERRRERNECKPQEATQAVGTEDIPEAWYETP